MNEPIENVFFLHKGEAGIVMPFPISLNILFVKIKEGDEIGVIDIFLNSKMNDL